MQNFFQAYIKASVEFKRPKVEDIVLDKEPYTWPQLFIYSKADKVTSWKVK